MSIPASLAFALISVSLSVGNFFVRTSRFNVGICLLIAINARILSALSTKTVFNEAIKMKH